MNKRWKRAQDYEKRHRVRNELSDEKFMAVLNYPNFDWDFFWSSVNLKMNKNTTLLDVGSAGKPVFINIKEGNKYSIDPMVEVRLKIRPILVDLYKDNNIKGLSIPLEEFNEDVKFDVIFCLNMLDHVSNYKPIIKKMDMILKEEGYLNLRIDLHTNSITKWIKNFFQPEPPHPHHFMKKDILKLFSKYKLVRYKVVTQDMKKRVKDLGIKRKKEKLYYRIKQYIVNVEIKRFIGVLLMTIINFFTKYKYKYTATFIFQK